MLDFLISFIDSSFDLVCFDIFSIAFITFLCIWAVFFVFKIVWGR